VQLDQDHWRRPGVSFSHCADRVVEWNVNGKALAACLAGKPGEFRAPTKGNTRKMVREYEYVRIRLGFLPKRVGPAGASQVNAVAILYRFHHTVILEMSETWADLEFTAGSFCMEFGEVVEWVGLCRWVNTKSGRGVGASPAMVEAFVSSLPLSVPASLSHSL